MKQIVMALIQSRAKIKRAEFVVRLLRKDASMIRMTSDKTNHQARSTAKYLDELANVIEGI